VSRSISRLGYRLFGSFIDVLAPENLRVRVIIPKSKVELKQRIDVMISDEVYLGDIPLTLDSPCYYRNNRPTHEQ
jgi:hypothetical protein